MSERPREPSGTAHAPAGSGAGQRVPSAPFGNRLGLTLHELRDSDAFATLSKGPWLVFIAIACRWRASTEAWPSQETIGRLPHEAAMRELAQRERRGG
jgi:hypothetical protein